MYSLIVRSKTYDSTEYYGMYKPECLPRANITSAHHIPSRPRQKYKRLRVVPRPPGINKGHITRPGRAVAYELPKGGG